MKTKVLVVDDDPGVLKILEEYLSGDEYMCVLADSGDKAWELMTKSLHNFSVVIADRMMPGLDGVQLTRRIRSNPAFVNIPVIMLTSTAERQEVIDAVQGGVFDFLLKPVEKNLLLLVLRRALSAV